MIVVGLTGGIGSGKSTVLEMFGNLGAAVYIADSEARKLMNTNLLRVVFINFRSTFDAAFGLNSFS